LGAFAHFQKRGQETSLPHGADVLARSPTKVVSERLRVCSTRHKPARLKGELLRAGDVPHVFAEFLAFLGLVDVFPAKH
jgi:hypothetical protein